MKHPSAILTFALFVCLTTLSSCSGILLACYGMKNPKQVNNPTILKQAKKYNIPASDCYVLDTSYHSYITSFGPTTSGGPGKEHTQPLQVLYFNKQRELVSFHNNCYTGGFPNLQWNRNGVMNTFPPGQQVPLDTLLSLNKLLAYVQPLAGGGNIGTDSNDYTVIVFWTQFMGRQSKRLIARVQDNRQLAKDKKVSIIYVNSDNQFALTK